MRKRVATLRQEDLEENSVVFFDTETTGLNTDKAEIIQLSAKCNENKFDCFVKPKHGLRKEISELTGISLVRGKLHHKNQPVVSKDIVGALTDFLNFLRTLKPGCKVVLVAHKAPYDMGMLFKALEVAGLVHQLTEICVGFVDTLPMATRLLPKSQAGPENHKINGLLHFFYGDVVLELHNAFNDVLALESIFQCLTEQLADAIPYSFQLNDYVIYKQTLARAKGEFKNMHFL